MNPFRVGRMTAAEGYRSDANSVEAILSVGPRRKNTITRSIPVQVPSGLRPDPRRPVGCSA